MTAAFVKNHTVASNKTSGTTLAVTLDTDVPAGNLIVLRMVYDNAATTLKPSISSVGRAAGETAIWQGMGYATSASTSAGAFSGGTIWYIRTTVAWPAASYTVTLDMSVTQKAGAFQEFSGVLAATRMTPNNAYSTTTTAASAATSGTAPVIGDLALGWIFGSNVAAAQAGDTDTTGGSWSAVFGIGSTGGAANTNNFGVGQYKILTAASHQTLNNSAAMTASNGVVIGILQAFRAGSAAATHVWATTAAGVTTRSGTATAAHAWGVTAAGSAPGAGTTVTDDFNRADAGTLGANWSHTDTSPTIVSNRARGGTVANISWWNAATFANDQYCEADFTLGGGEVGPMVRVATSGNSGYVVDWHAGSGGTLQFFRRISTASFTSLGIAATGVGTSGTKTLRLEVLGTTLTLYSNGSFVASVTDATHTSGAPGFWSLATSSFVEDFEGGDLAVAGTPAGSATVTHAWSVAASGSAPGAGTAYLNRTIVQAPRNGTNTHTVNFTAATAGNFLIAFAEGCVTSTTPTGWDLRSSAINNTGLYCWTKTATAGESSFTTTHNGSDFEVGFVVYEYAAGMTFATQNAAINQSSTAPNPDATLNPALTYTVFSVAAWGDGSVGGATGSATWSGTGVVEDVDLHVEKVVTDTYWFGIAIQNNLTGFSLAAGTPTITAPAGGNSERITVAFIPGAGGGAGTATISWVEATSAVGQRAPVATATTSWTEAITAAGQRTPKASATATWTETITAAGKRTPVGTTTTTWLETIAAAGKRSPVATVTVGHTWVATAQGVAPVVGVKQGSALVSHTWTASATGQRTPKGTTTASWTEAITATGKRAPVATTTVTWTEAITAAGKRTPKATSTVSHSWTTTAQGVAPIVGVKQGSALVVHTWTSSATGRRAPQATATTTWTEAITAAGRRTPKATTTVSHAWTTIAQGVAPIPGMKQGSALVFHAWAPSAVGERTSRATVTVTHTWTIAAVGAGRVGGIILNNADAIYLGTVAVDAVYAGEDQVWP